MTLSNFLQGSNGDWFGSAGTYGQNTMAGFSQQQTNGFLNGLMDIAGFGLLGSGASNLPPDENGWYSYIYSRPPKNVLLQFIRRGGDLLAEAWVDYADFGPMFNIANLYWRYTGIGRHQMDAL